MENEIQPVGVAGTYSPWISSSTHDSILPLTFFPSRESFIDFRIGLDSERRYNTLFKDALNVGIVGGKGIRDTILNEIGENIYQHARGGFGLFTMGRVSPLVEPAQHAARLASCSPLEVPFFHSLGMGGYLQIIIADDGIGIFASLKEEYDKHRTSEVTLARRTFEPLIIDYSFKFNTSRKREEEFLEESGQGRGLYWVKSLVKENRGLVSVRSGSSFVVYDYLNYDEEKPRAYRSNLDIPGLRNLSKLGGTQIKICIPLQPDLIRPRRLQPELRFSFSKPVRTFSYRVLFVKEYLDGLKKWTRDSERSLLEDLTQERQKDEKSYVTIVDFDGTNWTKDELFPLLVEFSQSQHDNRVTVVVNTDGIDLFSIASEPLTEKIRQDPLRYRIVPAISNSNVELLGRSAEDTRLLASVLQSAGVDEIALEAFCRRHEHIYMFNSSLQSVEMRLSVTEIENEIDRAYRGYIQRRCVENIFDFDAIPEVPRGQESEISDEIVLFLGKFITPSNLYADAYFRIAPLIANDVAVNRMLRLFEKNIGSLGIAPECLITTSKELEGFGETLAKNLSSRYGKSIVPVHLSDLRNENLTSATLIKYSKKRSIVISSVVGSARSVGHLVDLCQSTFGIQILGIFCLIDAREGEAVEEARGFIKHGSEKVPLTSIITRPVSFFSERPEGWPIEEIVRINPKTNAPQNRIEPASRPFWTDAEKHFLEVIVREAKGVQIGHFIRRSKHYLYFFDIARICEMFGEEIANLIRKDADEFLENPMMGVSKIGCVVFDTTSRGAQSMAEMIAKELNTETLSFADIVANQQNPKEKIWKRPVVIFSSAVGKGKHLQQLFAGVSQFKPSTILAYSIVHRRESDDVDFFQKIDSFAGAKVRVRSFVALEIPSFDELSCPICHRQKELMHILEQYRDDMLAVSCRLHLDDLEPVVIGEFDQIAQPDEIELDEAIARLSLRQEIGTSKTDFLVRKERVTDLITNLENIVAAKRLVKVLAREISALYVPHYEELFYDNFNTQLGKFCISILEQERNDTELIAAALILLRSVTPSLLVENASLIFRCVGNNHQLLLPFILELLLATLSKSRTRDLRMALEMCRISLKNDAIFFQMAVQDVRSINDLLSYLLSVVDDGSLNLETDSSRDHWSAFRHLWNNFVGEEDRVHPKLAQGFWDITGVTTMNSFKTALDKYAGVDGFLVLLDSISTSFDLLKPVLSRNSKNQMSYFLNSGGATFGDDLRILDSRMKFLETLQAQSRLSDREITRNLRDDLTLSACRRLQKSFEPNNAVSSVLRKKFSSLMPLLNDLLTSYDAIFKECKIFFEKEVHEATVFAPAQALKQIFDNLLNNIVRHAFDDFSKDRRAKIEIVLRGGTVEIIVADNGRGTSEGHLFNSPDIGDGQKHGIRNSQELLALYGGSLRALPPTTNPDFTTRIMVTLKTREGLFYETENIAN